MTEHGIERMRSRTEFRGIGLAQRYGAGPLAALDDQRIAFRHVVSVDRRAASGANALRVEQILVRNG